MSKSSRFMVAVHILTMLDGKTKTSQRIAESVNTNPVVIRRILGLLVEADLVECVSGRGGGAKLAKSADEITLADVYRAVQRCDMFQAPPNPPNPQCQIGRNVQDVLQAHLDHVETVMDQEMAKVTIADMLADVRSAEEQLSS